MGAWGRQSESLLLDHPDCDEPYCGQADVSKISQPTSDCSDQISLVNVWRVPKGCHKSDKSSVKQTKRVNAFWVIFCILIIILIIWLVIRFAGGNRYNYRRQISN